MEVTDRLRKWARDIDGWITCLDRSRHQWGGKEEEEEEELEQRQQQAQAQAQAQPEKCKIGEEKQEKRRQVLYIPLQRRPANAGDAASCVLGSDDRRALDESCEKVCIIDVIFHS